MSKGQHGGVRAGAGRPKERYKTKVVRIPEHIDAEEMVALIDDLRTLVNAWKVEADEAIHASSPRYDRFRKAISEVERLLPEQEL